MVNGTLGNTRDRLGGDATVLFWPRGSDPAPIQASTDVTITNSRDGHLHSTQHATVHVHLHSHIFALANSDAERLHHLQVQYTTRSAPSTRLRIIRQLYSSPTHVPLAQHGRWARLPRRHHLRCGCRCFMVPCA